MKFSAVFLALAMTAAAAPIVDPHLAAMMIDKRQYGLDLGSFTSSIPRVGSGSSSFGSLGSFDFLGSTGSTTGMSTGASSTESSSTASAASSASSTPSPTESGESYENCKAVTLIFARGTGESGTMGTIIGPPLAEALVAALGEDKFTGVDYPANSAGNADLGATGGRVMSSQAQNILTTCPTTKLVLAGYSQGAMVVHNALSAQNLDGSKVAAIVAFGDPFNGQDFEGVSASNVKEFCGSADSLCAAGGSSGSGTSHISYGGDAREAAEFIAGVVGQ